MATELNEKVGLTKAARDNIKQALYNKTGITQSDDIRTYANVIANIPTEGSDINLNKVKFAYSEFVTIPDWLVNSNWENINNLSHMFRNCIHLINIPNIDFSVNIVNTSSMFLRMFMAKKYI